MHFNWKIGGEAGFGIMTAGLVFSKIATRSGYHIFDYAEYPSLIRGGHNTYEVHVSDSPVTSSQWNINLLVCLNKETYDLHKHRLTEESMVMYDPDVFEITEKHDLLLIPFKTIQKEEKIQPNMLNTVAVAASVSIIGAELSIYKDIIKQQFAKKGEDVVNFNYKLADLGHAHATKHHKVQSILPKQSKVTEQIVIAGNESFSLASVSADCRHYASYPMTPASSVLTTLSAMQSTSKMVVRHPEDEISVVNAALGSSFAGVRSAVGTSGGGFALMVEALSYSGVAEIPLVVFLAMRSGPATGMPTWTEQGDLLFAVHGGHGEFPKIVLAPGDPVEMFELTQKAYDLADIYQTPVIVLSDKCLSESHISVATETFKKMVSEHVVDRGKIVSSTKQKNYLRYKSEEDGISEMLIPGQKGIFYQANSYEHLEDSHTTEDSEERIKQVNKRSLKQNTYFKNHFKPPQVYGDKTADIILVSYGSNKGPILDALNLHHIPVAYVHFTHVFPLDEEKIHELFKPFEGKRMILVENNSYGQFGQLLRMHTGINLEEKLLKFDGRPFWPEEIASYIGMKQTRNSNIEILNKPAHIEGESKMSPQEHLKQKKSLMDKLAKEMA
ncbi:MAG: 2-oxoacid:acceptor oxidoreductase subunit alpha [bacterium]|nr:2-oxoacid:acceptor oxidoreductase subunit alpha [bacterium]